MKITTEVGEVTKGDIVSSHRTSATALVLAVTRDGLRAKLHVFGYDRQTWRDISCLDVETSGDDQCWKCSGPGLYYFGGSVVNGVYQGQTGPCYACSGKGVQSNADRLRCYYYWQHDHTRDVMPSDS